MLRARSSTSVSSQEEEGEGESEEPSFLSCLNDSSELRNNVAAINHGEDVESLEEFRQQWLVEIAKKRHHKKYEFRQHLNPPMNVTSTMPKTSPALAASQTTTPQSMDARVFELAKQLYQHGLRAERAGSLTQAVQCYRQAMQLVPDIEFHFSSSSQQSTPGLIADAQAVSRAITPPTDDESKEQVFLTNIADISRSPFKRSDTLSSGSVGRERDSPVDLDCIMEGMHISHPHAHKDDIQYYPPLQDIPHADATAVKSRVHISQLPTEILLMVFRWVVGSNLDVRQLEVLSEVCRGFHALARDPSLWRSICRLRWGDDGTRDLYGGVYPSWRDMAIYRPHVHMDGCYIARASYVRHGEPTVGQVYEACYIVQYYRVMRFMPDGRMFFFTSTADPSVLVKQAIQLGLTSASQLPTGAMYSMMTGHGLLFGHYRLIDGHLSCVLKRKKEEQPIARRVTSAAIRRGVAGRAQEMSEQTFHLELQIKDAPHRLHGKLVWKHYSLLTVYKPSNTETVTEFDLNNTQYQPLVFSRVKSLMASVSDEPLPYL